MGFKLELQGMFKADARPRYSSAVVNDHRTPDQKSRNVDRLALYTTYTKTGSIQKHHFDQVSELKEAGYVVVASRAAEEHSKEARDTKLGDVDILKPNAGHDFGSWWFAIQWLKKNDDLTPSNMKSICMANDSYFGSVDSKTISDIEKLEGDLVGLSESIDGWRHIQSFFLMAKNRLLEEDRFTKRIDKYPFSRDKKTIVLMGEIGLTQSTLKNGMTCNQWNSYHEMADQWGRSIFEGFDKEVSIRRKLGIEFEETALKQAFFDVLQKTPHGTAVCPHHQFWKVFLEAGIVKRDTLRYGAKIVPSYYTLLTQIAPTPLFHQIRDGLTFEGEDEMWKEDFHLLEVMEQIRTGLGLEI